MYDFIEAKSYKSYPEDMNLLFFFIIPFFAVVSNYFSTL